MEDSLDPGVIPKELEVIIEGFLAEFRVKNLCLPCADLHQQRPASLQIGRCFSNNPSNEGKPQGPCQKSRTRLVTDDFRSEVAEFFLADIRRVADDDIEKRAGRRKPVKQIACNQGDALVDMMTCGVAPGHLKGCP